MGCKDYLYSLPKRSTNRLVSGHLAGYRFDLAEIEYLHQISGQWVGLIGVDYSAGWIRAQDPIRDTMLQGRCMLLLH